VYKRQDLKIYLPTDKKVKTNIRGFWKAERGISYDYIRQTRVSPEELSHLRKHYRQEALFYTRKSRAYVWHNEDKIEELKRCDYFGYDKHTRGLKAFLKDILARYGGFTIYIREANYLVEVWI